MIQLIFSLSQCLFTKLQDEYEAVSEKLRKHEHERLKSCNDMNNVTVAKYAKQSK